MSGHSRDTLVLVVVLASQSLLSGCGCEMYNTKVVAKGEGYAIEDPDQTASISMGYEGGPFCPGVLDATPIPNQVSVICMSMTEPYLDPDLYIELDYSLGLGVMQSGGQAPLAFGGCNGGGPALDPDHPTLVYGSIEFEGKEVELDSIEARSTSFKPPRYDVKLGGKDAEGKAYEFELEVKLDRAGNAVFCH